MPILWANFLFLTHGPRLLVGMDGPVLEKIMEETVVMVQLESVEVG